MSEEETVRDTSELSADGRLTMPDTIRDARDVRGKKAYLQWETFGKDKILITVLDRWPATKRAPGKDVVRK